LRGQVAVHLVVGEPWRPTLADLQKLHRVQRLTVKRDPGKARARTKTTSYLVDPRIVKLHPVGLVVAQVAWLDVSPEALALEVVARLHWVHGHFTLHCETQELHGTEQDRASGWVHVVLLAADPEDDGAEAEKDCW